MGLLANMRLVEERGRLRVVVGAFGSLAGLANEFGQEHALHIVLIDRLQVLDSVLTLLVITILVLLRRVVGSPMIINVTTRSRQLRILIGALH